jgi:hypothetical protein
VETHTDFLVVLGNSKTLSLARREEHRLREFMKGAEEGIWACDSMRRSTIHTFVGGKPLEGDYFEDLEVNGRLIRDRTCMCNVTLCRVRITVVAVEKQQCIISQTA